MSLSECDKLAMNTKENIDQEILEEIIKSIQQINYGEVVITVHDSDVVQIEKREKKRFKTRKLLSKQS
ncbi:YezD family protein [Candidatus Omnitrophota bacterium]